ncbi:MAG: hypothetical protein IKN94_02930 [Salinivirgaceae bacterium]|nr:hypothetical protein [Salinivirgaceae bacterium]
MMKNKNNIDVDVIRSGRRGYAIPFICLFVGLFFIIDSFLNADNFKIKARGEIMSVSKDSTSLNIKGIEIPFYMRDDMDRTKIHIGDYAEMLYSIESPHYNTIEQLKINGNMIYKFSWWRNNKVHVWFALIGAILIPIVVKERNEDVRKGEFDTAGPIIRTLVKVYPEDNDNEPTDIDYKEHSSIINEENLVYDSDMDYSVYKTDDKEIISVVFSDENGAYCRYFTLPDTEGEDYSQLAELASDIRNNAENYAEIEIDA